MPDGRKRILGPFTGRKKRKAWNKTRVKYMPVKRRQNLAETDKGSYYKEEWLEEFLDSKGAFYNGNESDNNDESYNENNEQQQLPEGFTNSFYNIVSPILLQKLINNFTVCKPFARCQSRFWNLELHIDQPSGCCIFMLCSIKSIFLN